MDMLLLSTKLKDQPVLSLRTGGKVAQVLGPVINPNNMKVVGFYCQDHFSGNELILLTQDIREHIRQGFVVNDHEVLADAEDLIRLKDTLEIQYDPIGKTVITDHKRKLGKVSDYAVDSDSLYVKKLYVTPRMLKSLTGSQLSIDRTQIVEVTDKHIVIKEATQKAQQPARQTTAQANLA